MMSSVSPSEKYSCSGSPDILSKGKTATEGFSGSLSEARLSLEPDNSVPHAQMCTGRAMFFSSWLTLVHEFNIDLPGHVVVSETAQGNTSDGGQSLDTRGNIDPVSVNVLTLD